ncbi:hypothetical protein PR202_gb25190 [Eleusine coracana subsp. coracana]|uniref:DUF6598 domain-containing protein n=1 Tax=Eleusine coracana subsp. coracana TaxID=191504 RepID=A0AAV5FMX5_ELECO|nr:hypothetical protein PR202_gb25190 [Eleusine coracana subsp. coracana]
MAASGYLERLSEAELSAVDESKRQAEADRRRRRDPEVRRAEREKIMRRVEQKMKRETEPGARRREALKRIQDFDPKQGGVYFTRLCFVNADRASFDYDEESPLGPMRFTDRAYNENDDPAYQLCEAVNIFSMKIASSDVGFPIQVYGTVIARDSIDRRCVYLFRRDRDHAQLISSEDESLILTGPKRGLSLISATYLETDLKIIIKQQLVEHQAAAAAGRCYINNNPCYKELSKGVLEIRGMERRPSLSKCELESCSLDTRLSTVVVTYGVMKGAVEATVSVQVLAGEFHGRITACTSSIALNSIVLHDSSSEVDCYGSTTTSDDNDDADGVGVIIHLSRRVVAVSLNTEMLSLTVVAETGGGVGKCEGTIDFAPRANGGDEAGITVGDVKMLVKITWSIIDF